MTPPRIAGDMKYAISRYALHEARIIFFKIWRTFSTDRILYTTSVSVFAVMIRIFLRSATSVIGLEKDFLVHRSREYDPVFPDTQFCNNPLVIVFDLYRNFFHVSITVLSIVSAMKPYIKFVFLHLFYSLCGGRIFSLCLLGTVHAFVHAAELFLDLGSRRPEILKFPQET